MGDFDASLWVSLAVHSFALVWPNTNIVLRPGVCWSSAVTVEQHLPQVTPEEGRDKGHPAALIPCSWYLLQPSSPVWLQQSPRAISSKYADFQQKDRPKVHATRYGSSPGKALGWIQCCWGSFIPSCNTEDAHTMRDEHLAGETPYPQAWKNVSVNLWISELMR